jgi:hypothetical protein
VAHFHDGHATAAPVEEFFAYAFEDGEGQSAGAGVEVECSFGGLSLGQVHGRSHDGENPLLAKNGGAFSAEQRAFC